jgi:hypothetical protein
MRAPAREQTGRVSDAEPRTDRFELVVLLAVYVVPLLATVAVLAWVGLPVLALALLSVEAGVSAAVVRAKRPPSWEAQRRGPGAAVPVLLVLSLVTGAAAVLLLVRPGTGG